MAPHCVCPKTRIKRLPSLPVQNASEPSMLPSACVQVFPALRKTKSSPGIASNTVSTGTRESAHPRMALCGAWLYFAKAFSISPEVLLAVWAPAANRSLPSFSIFQCHIWRHSFVCSRAHAMNTTRIIWSDHGRGELADCCWASHLGEAMLQGILRSRSPIGRCHLQSALALTSHSLGWSANISTRKLIVWNTFTLTAWAATSSELAPGPTSCAACSATEPRPCSKTFQGPILPFAAKHSKHPWRSS